MQILASTDEPIKELHRNSQVYPLIWAEHSILSLPHRQKLCFSSLFTQRKLFCFSVKCSKLFKPQL